MNTDVRKVKDVSSNTQILTATNPEIFGISPRPGGFLKVLVPTKSQDYIATDTNLSQCTTDCEYSRSSIRDGATRARKSPLSESPSREFRLKRAIDESDWEITAVDETDTVVGISNPLQETINMLAITISCVMLLASKSTMDEEYLTWAEYFLKCMTDDTGAHPPNISGILEEIDKKRAELKNDVPEIVIHSASKDSERRKSSQSSRRGSAVSSTPKRESEGSVKTLTTSKPSKKKSRSKMDVQDE